MHKQQTSVRQHFVQRTLVKIRLSSFLSLQAKDTLRVADKLKPYSIKVWQYSITFSTVEKIPNPVAPNILVT